MKDLTKIQCAKLHEKSSLHRAEMSLNVHASCFQCESVLMAASIVEWTDCNLTAICPRCSVDALLPGVYSEEVLKQMHKEYFT